jgi:hypothetical protein
VGFWPSDVGGGMTPQASGMRHQALTLALGVKR